jgi:hypothetical protein
MCITLKTEIIKKKLQNNIGTLIYIYILVFNPMVGFTVEHSSQFIYIYLSYL